MTTAGYWSCEETAELWRGLNSRIPAQPDDPSATGFEWGHIGVYRGGHLDFEDP